MYILVPEVKTEGEITEPRNAPFIWPDIVCWTRSQPALYINSVKDEHFCSSLCVVVAMFALAWDLTAPKGNNSLWPSRRR